MTRKFTLKSRTAADEINFSADFNEEQLAVATARGGPMLVVAGAGSGKTRALTYRWAWLIHKGVKPSSQSIFFICSTKAGISMT